jgi:hypothetical protein
MTVTPDAGYRATSSLAAKATTNALRERVKFLWDCAEWDSFRPISFDERNAEYPVLRDKSGANEISLVTTQTPPTHNTGNECSKTRSPRT